MHCEFCGDDDHVTRECYALAEVQRAYDEHYETIVVDAATTADAMTASTVCGAAVGEHRVRNMTVRRMSMRARDEYRTFMSEVAT